MKWVIIGIGAGRAENSVLRSLTDIDHCKRAERRI